MHSKFVQLFNINAVLWNFKSEMEFEYSIKMENRFNTGICTNFNAVNGLWGQLECKL